MVDARRAILQEMGILEENAFPLIGGCNGLMTPPPSKNTSGCPKDFKAIMAFGVPYAHVDSLWAMHRVEVSYASDGFMITISEVQFAERQGQWVVDHVEEMMVIE